MDPTFITRRECLRLGAFGIGGLSLARALELAEQAPAKDGPAAGKRPVSAILVWLDGGASHLETFDPKPGAPDEVRGPWRSIPTPLPNVLFGQGCERLAATLPKMSVVRSLCSDAGEHEIARHLLLTGYPMTPSLDYPNFGSVVSSFAKEGDMPPYLYVSPVIRGSKQLGAGFLPPEHNPFAIEADPNRPYFTVRDLEAPKAIGADGVARRVALVEAFDAFRRTVEKSAEVRGRSRAFERAYRLIASKPARDAFDVKQEPDASRDRYGRSPLGQSCLLARRLVEAGARFVTVNDGGWDTHAKCQEFLATHKLPKFDEAIPALINDLDERGLLETTLVLVMGEFGRTPRINVNEGRDHWPRASSALLAGAGVKRGFVLGATDEKAETVVERPVSPQDLAATLYTILGIDPEAEIVTDDGRPIRLVKDGSPVRELFA